MMSNRQGVNAISSYPLLYDLHHQSYQDDLPFWLSLADQQQGNVLELGCGAGRVLLPLAKAGNSIIGLDNDLAMLHYLAQHADLPSKVHMVCSDMTEFQLSRHFNLVLLPCNTCSTLTQSGRARMFSLVFRHLRPGGLFAFSVPNPYLLSQLPFHVDSDIEETLIHPLDGNPVQVSSAWHHNASEFTVDWHYDHLLPDGTVNRVTLTQNHFIIHEQSYLNEIEQAGFRHVTCYGDFNFTPYQDTSAYLIMIAFV